MGSNPGSTNTQDTGKSPDDQDTQDTESTSKHPSDPCTCTGVQPKTPAIEIVRNLEVQKVEKTENWFERNPKATKGIIIGATTLGTGIVSFLAAPLVAGAALGAVGFSSGGVVAGSIAAGIQSTIGNVAAGSLFALLQSAGAAGIGTATAAGMAATSAGVAATVTAVATKDIGNDGNEASGDDSNGPNGSDRGSSSAKVQILDGGKFDEHDCGPSCVEANAIDDVDARKGEKHEDEDSEKDEMKKDNDDGSKFDEHDQQVEYHLSIPSSDLTTRELVPKF